MSNLLPDYIFNNVCEIAPEFLKSIGVKAVLCDLDSTLMSVSTNDLPQENFQWIKKLKEANIAVMILSNNSRERRVAEVCKKLGIEFIHLAKKPLARGYRLATKRLLIEPAEVAMVGDQIYTDIFGANRLGMVSILVESLDLKLVYVRFRRIFEQPVIKKAKMKLGGLLH
ncbi:MAG: YqeG family HAD IIIA-type phosphatase [Clostridiales bacterium]|nr:YqeG family HAD IIIA-type phosphatase [Clostridiales bacterium]